MAICPRWGPDSSTATAPTGPYRPENGHRYNPNKLLLDPYARHFAGSLRWSDALFGYRISSPRADLSYDRRDSAPAMPNGVVTAERFDWGEDRPPQTPWSETVIYETHLRGLTMRLEDIPERLRGTAAALGHERTVAHLRSLGSPHSSSCRYSPACTTASCWSGTWSIIGATTP